MRRLPLECARWNLDALQQACLCPLRLLASPGRLAAPRPCVRVSPTCARVLGLPFGRAAALRRPVARLLRHAQRLRPLEAQRRWLGGGDPERLLRGQRVQHPRAAAVDGMDDVARADLVAPVKRRAHCTTRALREAHDLQLIASPVNLVLLILRQQGEFEAEVVEGHSGSVRRCLEGALELDGASALELDAAACEVVETSALTCRRYRDEPLREQQREHLARVLCLIQRHAAHRGRLGALSLVHLVPEGTARVVKNTQAPGAAPLQLHHEVLEDSVLALAVGARNAVVVGPRAVAAVRAKIERVEALRLALEAARARVSKLPHHRLERVRPVVRLRSARLCVAAQPLGAKLANECGVAVHQHHRLVDGFGLVEAQQRHCGARLFQAHVDSPLWRRPAQVHHAL
mmetsp:Transcript_34183/g.81350  ORF Transcript_34183/g.81350 Transcript_34183/m.81350 type:complete len:403 (+) Transcript_34183:145-1353(+)